MKKMYKGNALVLALVVSVFISLCACGKADETKDTSVAENTTSEEDDSVMANEKELAESETDAAESETEALEEDIATDSTVEEGIDWDSISAPDELDFMTEEIDGGICITKYLGTDTIVKIPDMIDGKTVVAIGEDAFYKKYDITDIHIPDSVIKLENGAFSACHNLRNINIPGGVTEIPKSCFANCQFLRSIELPDGVTLIDDFAFLSCKSLETLVLPDSVTTLGKMVFDQCENVEITYKGTTYKYNQLPNLLKLFE